MQRTTVTFTSPYKIELIQSALPSPGDAQVLIKTKISAISAGTELLLYRGQFPPNLTVDATIPALSRPFAYPLAYGYASVGRVVAIGRCANKNLLGQMVFCFHPHESHYVIHQDQVIPLPEQMAPDDAVFLASMETAVNLLMDGQPVIGENVVVLGQGIVGLLTTALLARLPLGNIVALEPCALRRQHAQTAGAQMVLNPKAGDVLDECRRLLKSTPDNGGVDLVYELSGNPPVLNQALELAGPGARIVVGSWYGTKKVEVDLGGAFHRNRIRLISSQVSSLAPRFSSRWSKKRRLTVALKMIRQLTPAHFITHRFGVQNAAQAYALLNKTPQHAVQVLLTYE